VSKSVAEFATAGAVVAVTLFASSLRTSGRIIAASDRLEPLQ
jgi:hypothetical protein